MCLLHGFQADHVVSDFQTHQGVRKLTLCSAGVVLPKLHFEEDQHVSQVLISLFVKNCFNLGIGVVLHLVKVLLEDNLAPNLDDFAEKGLCLYKAALFFEEFAHVVVTTAHVVAFRPILFAF